MTLSTDPQIQMTNIDNFQYDSFSHGQIKSKLWLCEQLEPYIPDHAAVTILGSWYNVLGFMLLVRNTTKYVSLKGIDIDPNAIDVSNKICDAWIINDNTVKNIVQDVNSVEYTGTTVVINCSPEHIEGDDWFTNIPEGTIVCIQSSNVTDPDPPWDIKTPSDTLETFINRYQLKTTHFCGILPIKYSHWGYDRFMIIGIK